MSLTSCSHNALSTLLGRPPGNIPELSRSPARLPRIDAISVQEIPAKLLLRRPDVRAAAWQVAAQSAQIGIAEAEYYPAITLLGSIGWSGNTLSAAPSTGVFTIGPGLKWNIFDHGRIANNLRLKDARLQQLIENYQQVALNAAREIDDAGIGIVKTAERQSILNQTVASSKRALDLATTRYREGYSDFQRVLDSQRSMFSRADEQLRNQGRHISALIGLDKGLGGGWVSTPIQELIPEDTRDTMKKRTDWGNLLFSPLPDRYPSRPSSILRGSKNE